MDETTMFHPDLAVFQPAFVRWIAGMRAVCGHYLFFPECSIDRVIAYFILTMGTSVLKRATGTALTLQRIEQRFTASGAIPEPARPACAMTAPDVSLARGHATRVCRIGHKTRVCAAGDFCAS
ncbi:hypothetical protein CJO92_17975 (plasmid) [Ralstonia solanacearum]|uniref:Uncharacterized protein n=2 Tax=Ralstonia solanacearum TaxID=305 RepID=A0AAD0S9E5_RALSL|nr:hypothetical protein CJO77_17975 [Ralstonia solanacearum]AXW54619.1 hypothetical protein CJO92_17975 [Ralstonia solanacearum]CBJ34657.1 hypothethical protein [Ralstonia solanacearum PSI07]